MAASELNKEIQEIVKRDLEAQEGDPIFINEKVINKCWHEVWSWVNVSSVGNHLLKYGVVSIMDLQYLHSPYHTPRQKADYLLTLSAQSGPNGYHLLYMCIKEDDENPLGHASTVEALIRTANELKGKRSTCIEQSVTEGHDHVDDSPSGQTISAVALPKDIQLYVEDVAHIGVPYQESLDRQSIVNDHPVVTSVTLCSHITPTISSIAKPTLHNTTSSDPSTCDFHDNSPVHPAPSRFSSFSGDSCDDTCMNTISEAITDTDLSIHELSVDATPSSPFDTILSQADEFLKYLDKEHLIKNIDVEMTDGKDYDDDTDSLQELVVDLIKFTLACLNSREKGVAITGVTCSDGYRLSGVPFQYDKLQNLTEMMEEEMKNQVSKLRFDGELESINDVKIFRNMYQVKICECIPHLIVIVAVVPNPQLCSEHLFAFYINRKPIIFCRRDGLLAQLKGPLLHKAQLQLHC